MIQLTRSPSGESSRPVLRFSQAELDCPVCPRGGIAAGSRSCPNCGCDLEPLRALRELPNLLCARAEQARSSGDLERALEYLSSALVLAGEDPELRARIGMIHWERGEREAASAQWERAPDDDRCRMLLRIARRRRVLRRIGRTSTGLAAALLVGGLAWSAWPLLRSSARAELPPVDSGGYSAVAARLRGPSAQPGMRWGAGPVDQLSERLRREPGVLLVRQGGALLVDFIEPLFPRGASEPFGSGAERLRRVAQLLDSSPQPLVIAVSGQGDERTSPIPDPSAEPLARARALRAIGAMAAGLGPEGSAALRPAASADPDLAARPAASARSVQLRIWAP